jgi:polysaccharide biosynthesis protein PslA
MEIKNKLQISKKTNILVSSFFLFLDIICFVLIYYSSTLFTLLNNELIDLIPIYAFSFILILAIIGGYSKKSLISISKNLKLIGVTAISMPFAFNFFLYQFGISGIANNFFINLLYLSFCLTLTSRVVCIFYIRHSNFFNTTILVIGDGEKRNLFNNYNYLDINTIKVKNNLPEEDPFFLNMLSKSVKNIDRVILDFDKIKEADRYANIVSSTSNNIEILRQMSRLPVAAINNFNGYQTLKLKTYGSDFKSMILKRAFDLILVTLSFPFWSLVLLICAIFIKIDSPGPIFFKQKRIGLRNEFFYIYKFRTMYHEFTDPHGSKLTEKNDIRVTKVGKFLRKSSLDELPQLINILKLQMSLVGPRPSTLEAKAGGKNYWDKFPEYWRRHMILPGMTGLAQIRGLRGNTFTKEDLLMRYKSDIEYLDNGSILLDIKIIIYTFLSLFSDESF